MGFSYNFPAVKGYQANSVYYICMIPCKYLSKLFPVTNDDIMPEYRAQRRLNETRIPDIKSYIIKNRNSYVFSALAASIDGSFKFNELDNGLGVLEIDMDSKFLINDGQHRNAALQEALIEDVSLGDETISIVFYEDKGLKRSQQMFTDLNKYAVKPSKSQNTYYDHQDKLAILSKRIVSNIDFLRDYIDVESDSLGKFAAKLFTLSSFYCANQKIVGNFELNEGVEDFCERYWEKLVECIVEWQLLMNKEISKKSLREDYLLTKNVVLYAFGKLGNYFLNHAEYDLNEYLPYLKNINWLRTNPEWEGKAIEKGKILSNMNNVNLLYLQIKKKIGIPLDNKEKNILKGCK